MPTIRPRAGAASPPPPPPPPHLDQRPLPAIKQRVLKLDVAAGHALQAGRNTGRGQVETAPALCTMQQRLIAAS
jgi:hypothetical protein